MSKKIIVKILSIVSIIAIFCSSFVMAATGIIPKFSSSRVAMRLGSTQSISGIINVEASNYAKIKSSNPSVVTIQSNGQLKALSTGISTLSYKYTSENGEEKEIWCYVEVAQGDSTYSEIDSSNVTKIKITLELGDYTTTIESPSAAIPALPEVKKDEVTSWAGHIHMVTLVAVAQWVL